jgi:hypothetical protein
VCLKSFIGLIILAVLSITWLAAQTEELMDSRLKSTQQYESAADKNSQSKDTIIGQDSVRSSVDEEQAGQIKLFINATLIIIILAVLILAVTIILIINRVRRSKE